MEDTPTSFLLTGPRPSDYRLFRSLQNSLINKTFQTPEAVRDHLEFFFESKPEDFYRRGIEAMPSRWRKLIEKEGHYFVERILESRSRFPFRELQ